MSSTQQSPALRTDAAALEPPAQSFYERVDEAAFVSTAATESPWNPQAQHGGPPSGLLARAIEEAIGDEPLTVAKIDLDFLGPIPQGRCETTVSTVRPGRRVRLVEASMTIAGQVAVGARAWLVSYEEGRAPRTGCAYDVPALPEAQAPLRIDGVREEWGYGRSVEWRFVSTGERTRVWGRTRIPLVAGEETSNLQRLMVLADSTNGVSTNLSGRDWLFIPPGISVTVQRPPASAWTYFDAASHSVARGTGVAHAIVADEHGLCGYVTQPLLVAPQG